MDDFNQWAQEAHDEHTLVNGTFSPRLVAIAFVAKLEAHSNDFDVAGFMDRMLVAGASKWMTDWRRRARREVKTVKGTQTDVGQWAGIITEDGEYQQMPLFAMTAEQLKQHRKKLRASRDTLSVEIRFLSDLIEAIEQDASLKIAADAVAKLGLAA